MRTLRIGTTVLVFFALPSLSWAHCEIPCGIYDDEARIRELQEHITTMERAIHQIQKLTGKAGKDPLTYNQLVRWISNKDKHAEKFQYIIWQYFLTQRVKPVEPRQEGRETYLRKLELLHQLSFYAMKVKQHVDTRYTEKLRELLEAFEKVYFEERERSQ